ncbi:FAD-dependent oxidoreductase [Maridesulfovibrio bastinii]|uniref:FAD-dependent oxidoreductase n=1 Tax=Maridesulfovibrio bastinii TaxID=47157 RepID=UPI0004275FF0|nr:FAD-dependent oxidoreductase [Maridesulfovibrio bastinii]
MCAVDSKTDYSNFFSDDSRKYLDELFKGFKETVKLELYTEEGPHEEFNRFAMNICRALAALCDKITLEEIPFSDERAQKNEIIVSPTILIAPDKYDLRFLGTPSGEEGRAFIEGIHLASIGAESISKSSMKILNMLQDRRDIKVFASPACPYCPGQVINAFKAAIGCPEYVSAWCVSTQENEEMAENYLVGSVPHTSINDDVAFVGLEPEDKFMAQLLHLKSLDEIMEGQGVFEESESEDAEVVDVDLVIIGAGPAGMSAGIYAARSGMEAVILEKHGVGGQVALTPKVENYPGFSDVGGLQLAEILSAHARIYTEIKQFVDVKDVRYGETIEVETDRIVYRTKGILIATGVDVKTLDVPGEKKFYGRGVSYCATCDGNFYRDKKVYIIGGGNTALTDALYLKKLNADVKIIHRRDKLRAEQALKKSVAAEGIEIIWDTVVTEILGEDSIEGIRVRNQKDGSESVLETDGVFVAIGHIPNTVIAGKLGVEFDSDGFIKVDGAQKTSVPRVYAAGDITGGVRQIVTAIGQGSVAALTAFQDFSVMGD